jgi:hypothetical protein
MTLSAPHISEHCRLRYIQRAVVVAPSITTAWDQAVPVEIEHHNQKARLNNELDVLFLHRANTVMTVLTAAYEGYTPLERREPSAPFGGSPQASTEQSRQAIEKYVEAAGGREEGLLRHLGPPRPDGPVNSYRLMMTAEE